MGLALAHTLAERQGIRLSVRSRPGRGTIVNLHWPPPGTIS
jgi:signal transduction histidine kinase